MVEEVSGVEESLRDVVEHVGNVFIDTGPIGLVVDPLPFLRESG